MKRIEKYFFGFLAIVVILYISIPILQKRGFWYYKLVGDYYLMGQGNGSYSIKTSFFSSSLIKDLDDRSFWMISDKGIYGYVNSDRRFYLDRITDSVQYFYDSGSFSQYLMEHNEKSYDLSVEEGLMHLRMNEDRIYKE